MTFPEELRQQFREHPEQAELVSLVDRQTDPLEALALASPLYAQTVRRSPDILSWLWRGGRANRTYDLTAQAREWDPSSGEGEAALDRLRTVRLRHSVRLVLREIGR